MTYTYYLPILISVVCFLYYFFTRTFNVWKQKNVKGPTPLPFFGNLKDMVLRKKQVGMIYNDIYKQYPDEKVVGIYRLTTPSLIIRDLDLIKQILIKDFDMFPDRGIEFSVEKLGDNLFHCGHDTWKVLRSRFTPVFTSGKLRSIFYLVAERGDRFIDYLENVSRKQQEHNMYQLFSKYNVATLLAAFFNLDLDTFNGDGQLFNLIDKLMFTSTYASELDFLFPGILKRWNLSIFDEKLVKFCHEVAQTVIIQKGGSPTDRCDIMDVLMSLRQIGAIQPSKNQMDGVGPTMKITDNVIAGQIFVFYAAGNGNNSLALSYAMYYLAKNPEMQDKLVQEIDEVLMKHDGKLTYDSLKEMKYLDMVFAETLRLNPLTNSISRAASQDYKFMDIDLTIKKGTTVVISPYAIQHDEKYYPNPEKFEPERFLPEVAGNRHPCAYLPFGAGPRVCLGSRFANIQFGICAVKLLSKYRVELSPRTSFKNNYDPWRNLLTPEGGLYLNIVPRKR